MLLGILKPYPLKDTPSRPTVSEYWCISRDLLVGPLHILFLSFKIFLLSGVFTYVLIKSTIQKRKSRMHTMQLSKHINKINENKRGNIRGLVRYSAQHRDRHGAGGGGGALSVRTSSTHWIINLLMAISQINSKLLHYNFARKLEHSICLYKCTPH